LRRVLGGLFGNSILTSEGRDWRWQHQIAAPLFRHDEIVRYLPAMVAGAESAIKSWSAAPPGSTHAIDADMLNATYDAISNILLPGSALIGETMKRGTADYVKGSLVDRLCGAQLASLAAAPGRRRMRFGRSVSGPLLPI
jgi:cytochrome P450